MTGLSREQQKKLGSMNKFFNRKKIFVVHSDTFPSDVRGVFNNKSKADDFAEKIRKQKISGAVKVTRHEVS